MSRSVEFLAYAFLSLLLSVFFTLFLMTQPAPASAPVLPSTSACADANKVLEDVSRRVSEDVRPLTTLGVKDMRPDFLAYELAGQIYVSDRVLCSDLRDIVLHEYGHVLQHRLEPMRPSTPDLEVEADLIAEAFGATLQPYIEWHGYAVHEHNHDNATRVLDESGK